MSQSEAQRLYEDWKFRYGGHWTDAGQPFIAVFVCGGGSCDQHEHRLRHWFLPRRSMPTWVELTDAERGIWQEVADATAVPTV